MPLLQRSLSDSQLYNKKVSRIVSRIKKQAHLPDSFDDLTHPQTFTNIGDWIKHWDQYHERVKYWLVKFSQVDKSFRYYLKNHHKWDSLHERHRLTRKELEETREKLRIVQSSDRIDFFENEKLANRILVLEKHEREDYFTPEIKQQISQNTTRFIEWKNQDTVSYTSEYYRQWCEWEKAWTESFSRLFYLPSQEKNSRVYHQFYGNLTKDMLKKVEFIISKEWFTHPDPEDFIIDEISIDRKMTESDKKVNNQNTGENNNNNTESDSDSDSENNVTKRIREYRENRIATEVPIFGNRLKLVTRISDELVNYQQTIDRYWTISWFTTNVVLWSEVWLHGWMVDNLSSIFSYMMYPMVNILLLLLLIFQYSISYFPKYSGFMLHHLGGKVYKGYISATHLHPIYRLWCYWKQSHMEMINNWKETTIFGYQVYRNRVIEFTGMFLFSKLLFLTGLTTCYSSQIIIYWNWSYSNMWDSIIFKPYQDWMSKIKYNSLKTD